jgi:hypothetical protein
MFLMVTFFAFSFTDLKAVEVNDTIRKANDTVPTAVKAEKPVTLTPYHRNVIKFNPTPMLLMGNVRNITLSYERLIKNNMSVSVQLGYLLFPKLIDDTLANLVTITEKDKSGINIAFDYRYYPMSRNRRPAPDGLYLGTYLSYYGFNFNNRLDVLYTTADQGGGLNGRLNIVNLGIELGYQFVFWKRLTLDLLLFGPSISYYQGYLEINAILDKSQIDNIDQEFVDKLLNRFPVLGYLFSGESLTFTGSKMKFGTGFRYSIQLGFHF